MFSFSTYPFENRLYQIKNIPLAQVAKRMSEISKLENEQLSNGLNKFPLLKNRNSDGHFSKIIFENFSLISDYRNKWFLTFDSHIVAMNYAFFNNEGTPFICGSPIKVLKDVFETPIKSSYLNIFKSFQAKLENERVLLYKIQHI